MEKKQVLRWSAVVLLLAGLLSAALLFASLRGRSIFDGATAKLDVDLGKPDVLIQSQELAALPRELVELPGLREVLTQDFVQYYEEHPDRLTLEGTLRRLAFEHQLTWQDRLVAAILAAPAQVALWSDGKGRLAYAALLIEKNTVAAAIEQLGKVALPDSQLARAGTVDVNGGEAVVYALTLRRGNVLLLVSSGKHLLVLTHPGLLLDEKGQLARRAADTARTVMEESGRQWREDLAAAPLPASTRHAITAKASWLSFGYQHFFPQVHALKFDVTGQRWSLAVAAAAGVWQDWSTSAAQAWNVLPRGAALCAALPVTWESAGVPLGSSLGADATPLTADLLPGAAVCWYAANGLYAPVLAARFKPGTGARHDDELRALLANSMKTVGKRARTPVQRDVPGGRLWSTDVASPYGYLGSGKARSHRATVLREGDVVVASVDHRAIEQVLAVGAKTYPALADDFSASPVLLSTLPELGRMLQTESLRLTQSTPAFLQLVRTRLKPRLDAMGSGGLLGLAAAQDAGETHGSWVWKTLTAK